MKKIHDPIVLEILELFSTIHESAWLVGGCVRDMILEKEIHDIDITTSAEPEVTMHLFQQHSYKVIPTGLKHGTVTIMKNNFSVEITTYRTEQSYIAHRAPESVSFTKSLTEDLKRRDFTMNAIAWHPIHGFQDPFHGQEDIKNKYIRCVGNADERLQEDALRILRAIRFHCTLHFSLDSSLYKAIKNNAHLLSYISKERIQSEFNRILLQDYPDTLLFLIQMNVMHHIWTNYLSDIQPTDINQINQIVNHTNSYPLESKLAILLHTLPEPKAEAYLKELKYDKKTIRKTLMRIRYLSFSISKDTAVLRLFASFFHNDMEEILSCISIMLAFRQAASRNIDDILVCKEELLRMYENKEFISMQDLVFNGNDLRQMFHLEGSAIREMLNKLYLYILENPTRNTKEQLSAFIEDELKK